MCLLCLVSTGMYRPLSMRMSNGGDTGGGGAGLLVMDDLGEYVDWKSR